MATKNDGLLQQADSVWKMLDDLADTDPDGYRKFIDNIMKEEKEYWKPPEPVFCLKTVKIAESSNPDVFINICKWEMVSKPKDGEARISIKASTLRYVPESKYSVMDVCLHNDVIGSSNKDVQQWKYISYLDDLSNVMKNVKCTGQNGAPPTIEVPLQKNSRNSLIQEIPTKKHKNKDGMKPIPIHFIKVCAASNEIPKCIVVQVELPKVKSGTECDLEVSKSDLLLISPYYSKLFLPLPHEGNQEETTSFFNKKTHKLTVKIPVNDS
ncbi:PIH1 domain-containing protein 2-like isoform X2 [Xenia sp. Carnegie-2017]|uniref:PIH1 domain-containing protein 2-like isoform X2 n=1 Tax=Xenia sp. Carnegie-2017 TaxID=2897299 RepID=UPI001F039BF6|nr:PIH1 domain-containing protein 2-like isoform X2 [Xenia sp. Carnegie-2017]